MDEMTEGWMGQAVLVLSHAQAVSEVLKRWSGHIKCVSQAGETRERLPRINSKLLYVILNRSPRAESDIAFQTGYCLAINFTFRGQFQQSF